MLSIATALDRTGFQDWLIQRVSGFILAAYALFLLGFWILQPEIDYMNWQILFNYGYMRFFSMVVLLSILAHAWIGLWIVSTDYLKNVFVRLAFQLIVYLLLLFYFICADTVCERVGYTLETSATFLSFLANCNAARIPEPPAPIITTSNNISGIFKLKLNPT